MPSPILPSEFESLVSTSGTPACTSFKNFNTFISRFSEWYSWAFSSDGTISPESATEINALINQPQSWSEYHDILVTPQVIAEARA